MFENCLAQVKGYNVEKLTKYANIYLPKYYHLLENQTLTKMFNIFINPL